jgi:hypothetical protein
LAHHHHHHQGSGGDDSSGDDSSGTTTSVPLHGPGSTHNPIVYHPVHGEGSSHNPIVVSKSPYPPGTVVHDHRNGKDCSYIAGDEDSYMAYLRCEHPRGGH